MIKLSVIVPVYNTEKYLRKCLNSLVNQTLSDIEIIVVNDGSTDNSKEIIDEYEKKYDNLKGYHLKNGGVSKARNYGIKKAKGKYITFLDSDDYVDHDLYEKMYEKSKGNDIVECDFIWEYEKEIRFDRFNHDMHPLLATRAVVWNRIYDRKFLLDTKVTFHDDVYYEDVEFCYNLFSHIKNIAYVNDSYVHYVQREGSITSDKTEKLKDIFKVLDSVINYYKDNNLYNEYHDEIEFLYVRYTLGSSFYRVVKVGNSKLRNELLDYSYDKLISTYPQYKKNKYVKKVGLKNLFYLLTNKVTLKIFGFIFSIIKR